MIGTLFAVSACCRAFYAPYCFVDFAWENDCVGMRAYGASSLEPQLNDGRPETSGIDIFNKRTERPMMEQWLRESNRVSCHHDRGEGMDNYVIGSGCGCGGLALRTGDGTWRYAGKWTRARTISETSGKAVFELVYDEYVVRGTIVRGCPLVKFEVALTDDCPAGCIGPGLDVSAERSHDGLLGLDAAQGYVANWEPDGVAGEKGSIATAIVLPGGGELVQDDRGCVHLLQKSRVFTYYAGSSWSCNGHFADAESWRAYVRSFAEMLSRVPADADAVVGTIADCERHACGDPRLEKAFAFLNSANLQGLEVGRYEIDGKDVFAFVQEAKLMPQEEMKIEGHRKYIDIQVPISGAERFGVGRLTDENYRQGEFSVEKDVGFYRQPMKFVTVQPGEFAMFRPPFGAHGPCLQVKGAATIKKLVIKVRVGE